MEYVFNCLAQSPVPGYKSYMGKDYGSVLDWFDYRSEGFMVISLSQGKAGRYSKVSSLAFPKDANIEFAVAEMMEEYEGLSRKLGDVL